MRRRQRRPDAGFTLVETMVTTALLMIVLAMVLPLIAGSLNIFTATQVRSDAVDNAQLALTQIGHDVVSSNLLYIDSTTDSSVPVVHMETYGTAAASTCVEYRVYYAGTVGVLQRQTKAAGSSVAWPAGWTTVMTGIVNSSQLTMPLVFSQTSASQYRSLGVNLWVQLDTRAATTAAAASNYTSTFTGTAIPAASTGFSPSLSTEPC